MKSPKKSKKIAKKEPKKEWADPIISSTLNTPQIGNSVTPVKINSSQLIQKTKLDLGWTKAFFEKDFEAQLKKSRIPDDINTQMMRTVRQHDEGISELN